MNRRDLVRGAMVIAAAPLALSRAMRGRVFYRTVLIVAVLATLFFASSAQLSRNANLDSNTYAQIYVDATPGPTTTLTTAGTFYLIDTLSDGLAFGLTTDGTNGTITVGTGSAGVYSARFAVSYTSSNQEIYHFSIFVNGSEQNQSSLEDKAANSSDVTNVSSGGLLNLAAGDVIDLRVTAENNNRTLTTNHVSLVVKRQR